MYCIMIPGAQERVLIALMEYHLSTGMLGVDSSGFATAEYGGISLQPNLTPHVRSFEQHEATTLVHSCLMYR